MSKPVELLYLQSKNNRDKIELYHYICRQINLKRRFFMKKIIKKQFQKLSILIILILGLLSSVIFPLLSLYAIQKNIPILVILSTIYAILYSASMLQRGELFYFVLLYLLAFFIIQSFKSYNPYTLSLIQLPLLDFIHIVINFLWNLLFHRK